VPLQDLCAAILNDVVSGLDVTQMDIPEASSIQVQSYLRHAMAETISEGIINCLIVTNSTEANIQLTRIHEHIFARGSWGSFVLSLGIKSDLWYN
jgi:hypothetical protein